MEKKDIPEHVKQWCSAYELSTIPGVYREEDAPNPEEEMNNLQNAWFDQRWQFNLLGHTIQGTLKEITNLYDTDLFFGIEPDPPIDGVEKISISFEYCLPIN